ncbi:Homeobox-leucine zipper protein ROC5 [Linum perenne]
MQVTWLEHSEYDESLIHGMLRPVISSGLGFGAKRWVTTLQRYCQCLNILMASATMPEDPSRKYLSSLNFEYYPSQNRSN